MANKKPENNLVTPRKSDIECLAEHIDNLKKHLAKNKLDNPTKRALGRREAKLKKLKEYLAE